MAAYLVAASLPSLASSRSPSSASVGTWWKLAGWLAIAASSVRAAPGWSSRSSSAGRLASVMTSWATAPERRNASIEVSKSDRALLQLPVGGVQERGVAGHEALEEPHPVLGDQAVPSSQTVSARCGSAFEKASPTIHSV